jgi:hypothetical protein
MNSNQKIILSVIVGAVLIIVSVFLEFGLYTLTESEILSLHDLGYPLIAVIWILLFGAFLFWMSGKKANNN